MDSGLSGMCLTSTLVGQLSTISRNWLTLRGAVPTGSARPQMSKHQNTENKDMINTGS